MHVGAIVRFSEQRDAWRVVSQDSRARRLTLQRVDRTEVLTVALGQVQLEPFPLVIGAIVTVSFDDSLVDGTVLHVTVAKQALRRLIIRLPDSSEVEYDESAVTPMTRVDETPLGLLEALHWRGPTTFYARLGLHEQVSRWFEETDGLPSLAGARVEPLGHQIYAATRVLRDRRLRFILADEVGLGKTIEAGYVLQALLAADPSLRCLVVTPGAMARQWLMELYLRFGARGFHLIEETGQASAKDGWQDNQRVIVSATTLLARESTRIMLSKASWDLVILDEAHHYARSHPLFPVLRAISEKARGVLALSATPSKREIGGLLAVLELVSPDTYTNMTPERLQETIREREPIWLALSTTIDLQKSSADEVSEEHLQSLADGVWDGVLPDDPVIQGFRSRLREGDHDAMGQLVAYVQEYHRIDHRITRTRRKTLASFGDKWPERSDSAVPYEATDAELLALDHVRRLPISNVGSPSTSAFRVLLETAAASSPARLEIVLKARQRALTLKTADFSFDAITALCGDPGGEEQRTVLEHIVCTAPRIDGEEKWLEEALELTRDWTAGENGRFAAAANWIVQQLAADASAKILVFSQFDCTAYDFAVHLGKRLPVRSVATFTHLSSRKELEAAADAFQHDPRCRVLISDELGGEGRNFQFASAVVHLDHPLSPSRVEQRIGRLDRLGRDPDDPVVSITLEGPSEMERQLLMVHRDVFRVYERSIGGLEFVLPGLHRELVEAVGRAPNKLADQLDLWRSRVVETLEAVDRDFEYMLDSARPELERAREVAELLREAGEDREAATLTRQRFQMAVRKLEIVCRELREPPESATFTWSGENLAIHLAGLERGEHQYTGTFARDVALQFDNVQFFGPGHILVDGLLAGIERSSSGRLSVFTRSLGGAQSRKCFAVFVMACEVDFTGVHAGLITRARRHLWPEWKPVAVELDVREPEAPRLVPPGRLRDQLIRSPETSDRKASPEAFGAEFRKILRAVRAGVSLAQTAVNSERGRLRSEGAGRLRAELASDIGYNTWRKKRATGAEFVQLDEELAQLDSVIAAVERENVVLDSLALVMAV